MALSGNVDYAADIRATNNFFQNQSKIVENNRQVYTSVLSNVANAIGKGYQEIKQEKLGAYVANYAQKINYVSQMDVVTNPFQTMAAMETVTSQLSPERGTNESVDNWMLRLAKNTAMQQTQGGQQVFTLANQLTAGVKKAEYIMLDEETGQPVNFKVSQWGAFQMAKNDTEMGNKILSAQLNATPREKQAELLASVGRSDDIYLFGDGGYKVLDPTERNMIQQVNLQNDAANRQFALLNNVTVEEAAEFRKQESALKMQDTISVLKMNKTLSNAGVPEEQIIQARTMKKQMDPEAAAFFIDQLEESEDVNLAYKKASELDAIRKAQIAPNLRDTFKAKYKGGDEAAYATVRELESLPKNLSASATRLLQNDINIPANELSDRASLASSLEAPVASLGGASEFAQYRDTTPGNKTMLGSLYDVYNTGNIKDVGTGNFQAMRKALADTTKQIESDGYRGKTVRQIFNEKINSYGDIGAVSSAWDSFSQSEIGAQVLVGSKRFTKDVAARSADASNMAVNTRQVSFDAVLEAGQYTPEEGGPYKVSTTAKVVPANQAKDIVGQPWFSSGYEQIAQQMNAMENQIQKSAYGRTISETLGPVGDLYIQKYYGGIAPVDKTIADITTLYDGGTADEKDSARGQILKIVSAAVQGVIPMTDSIRTAVAEVGATDLAAEIIAKGPEAERKKTRTTLEDNISEYEQVAISEYAGYTPDDAVWMKKLSDVEAIVNDPDESFEEKARVMKILEPLYGTAEYTTSADKISGVSLIPFEYIFDAQNIYQAASFERNRATRIPGMSDMSESALHRDAKKSFEQTYLFWIANAKDMLTFRKSLKNERPSKDEKVRLNSITR